jgi:hypothetical protein
MKIEENSSIMTDIKRFELTPRRGDPISCAVRLCRFSFASG